MVDFASSLCFVQKGNIKAKAAIDGTSFMRDVLIIIIVSFQIIKAIE